MNPPTPRAGSTVAVVAGERRCRRPAVDVFLSLTASRPPRYPTAMLKPHAGAFLVGVLVASSCSSVDVVRLQPDQLDVGKGMEPVAGIQATCLGFYLFTLGLPEADLDKAINELLMKEAKKIGAQKVIDLHFDQTPGGGIWWLTKLLGFRSATAWGIAIRPEPGADDVSMPPPPPPPPAPGSAPASQPKQGPGAK
jgi:hypothetical protein